MIYTYDDLFRFSSLCRGYRSRYMAQKVVADRKLDGDDVIIKQLDDGRYHILDRKSRKVFYKVEITFLGADAPSVLYFETRKAAYDYVDAHDHCNTDGQVVYYKHLCDD